MFEFNLFHLAFLGQVLLLSGYFPAKLLGQMNFVAENYPPDEYPKLYSRPAQHYVNSRRRFKLLNAVIFLSGLALLAWFMASTRDLSWDGPRITWFYLLQLLPVILMDLSLLKEFRLMRLADSGSRRQAELKPRRLFDFVSPVLFTFAVAVYVAFCLFIVYMNQFDYSWFGGYTNIYIITATNLFLVAIGWRQLRGRKLDPHQAPEDRRMKIQNILLIMILTSIAVTLYAGLTIT
ncbi:MAG: hypothetical protein HKO64_02035, partial [Xanthomonadales bacterium]|nr:hypothetical protein [Xanthomonadales bacterium]